MGKARVHPRLLSRGERREAGGDEVLGGAVGELGPDFGGRGFWGVGNQTCTGIGGWVDLEMRGISRDLCSSELEECLKMHSFVKVRLCSALIGKAW